ncbi:MAG: hypothetical protein ABEJ99_01335 [Candidatus Nanohaloarchaea archaeon]
MKLEKNSGDLQTGFRLGFLNPSSRRLEVQLSAEPSPEYDVDFEKSSFILEPSPVTTDPEGSGWYHLGEGRYTRFDLKSFTVNVSRHRFSNDIVVPIRIEARLASPGKENGGSQNVVQVREYLYRIHLDPSLQPQRDKNSKPDQGQWKQRFWQETSGQDTGSKQEDSGLNSSDQPDDSIRSTSNSSKSYKATRKDDYTEKGIDTTTILLLTGIVACIGYVYRVL